MKKVLIIDLKDTMALETQNAIMWLRMKYDHIGDECVMGAYNVDHYYDYTAKEIDEIAKEVENFHYNIPMPIGSWVTIHELMDKMIVLFFYSGVDNPKNPYFSGVEEWLQERISKNVLLQECSLDNINADYVYSANPSFLEKINSKNKILKRMPYNDECIDYHTIQYWSEFLSYLNDENLDLKFSDVALKAIER